MIKRTLPLAIAAAVSGVVLTSTAAQAAVVYKSDATGDTTGYNTTATTRKNGDLKKVAIWKESGRIFVKAWIVDLTSPPGISGSVSFRGYMSGTRTTVELAKWRGAGGAYLLVNDRPRCASSLTSKIDLTANTFVISAPASCMPAGTWVPRADSVAFQDNYHHAKDYSGKVSVKVR